MPFFFFLQALFMYTDHLEWSDVFMCGVPLNLPVTEFGIRAYSKSQHSILKTHSFDVILSEPF